MRLFVTVLPAQIDGPSPFEILTPTVALVETLATDVARRLGAAGNARLDRYGSIADQWVRPFGGAATDELDVGSQDGR